ncbi:hypothetical protein B4098_0606 [Heyndrickxia coagulans]|jgi:hypothetical protein|uniref:Uncharacterized protein n=1 Tax=Heyndrickxia coagulans TaxID=1398 RepID=A0A150JTB7_HEYCO|nr:hypothetical protein BCO26_0590 [Heyndrickxia coagulans 2-6]KYC60550.1 hypothetical protein B4098_0606 [Heyndrickxia coagulans]
MLAAVCCKSLERLPGRHMLFEKNREICGLFTGIEKYTAKNQGEHK